MTTSDQLREIETRVPWVYEAQLDLCGIIVDHSVRLSLARDVMAGWLAERGVAVHLTAGHWRMSTKEMRLTGEHPWCLTATDYTGALIEACEMVKDAGDE